MKIAISTENGYVAAHFGRCVKYTLVNIEDNRITHKEEIDNPGHQPGFLPEFLGARGVNLIISGGMGPRAQGLFAQKNIQTIIGVQGPINEVIENYIQGKLKPGEDLCDHGHEHHMETRHPKHHERHSLSLNDPVKICITALGNTIDSEVDPKFGRAQYFLFLTPDSDQVEAISNPNKELAHGAGIQAAQFISSKNPSVVITGELGPNADRVMKESGIRIITGVKGKVKDVLKDYMEREG
jgi:predicted Fe-Mo cluster-binding NifX family protein